jgi:hypothetical protein
MALKDNSLYKVYKNIQYNFRHLCNLQTFTYYTLNTTCFDLSGPSSGASTKPDTLLPYYLFTISIIYYVVA